MYNLKHYSNSIMSIDSVTSGFVVANANVNKTE